jgi:retron-type reverse transcriptase
MLKLIKQTLTVGVKDRGQVVATTVGVSQGSPISPLYSNISLNLLDHLWHRRGYPEKLGATLHRYADDAIVVCRRSPQPVLAACEAIATRMELTLNRAKTRVTRLTDGFAFVGCNFVKRQSPSSGKNTIYLVSGSYNSMMRLVEATKRAWYKWLCRRSQRTRLHWERFTDMLRWWPLPRPRITVRIWDG